MNLQTFISFMQAAMKDGLIDENATLAVRANVRDDGDMALVIDWGNNQVILEV